MLSVDGNLIIVFILIWVLLVILTKIFFNPVRKVMRKRDKGIKKDRKAGEEAVEKYEEMIRKIEEDIRSARASAYKAREKFEKEAGKEKERMLTEVSGECRAQIEQAGKELNEQLDSLKAEIKSESRVLAEKIEQRLLKI